MRLVLALLAVAVGTAAAAQSVRLTIPLDGSFRPERLGTREIEEAISSHPRVAEAAVIAPA